MGLLSGIKKFVKKALKLTGISQVFKGAKSLWDGFTGKTAAENMAKTQESQLNSQREQAKLNASNEIGNVAQFDGVDLGDITNSARRKKRSTGAYASGIGLQV